MANPSSTRPMDCANDAAAGFVTQAQAVLVTIIDAVDMDAEHLNLLYSIRSLLDAAFNRIADARDAVPQVAELVPHALAQAIGEQQRQVWQAQAVIQCVTQALYNHFGDWPANLPQWNLALETADQMLAKAAQGLWDDMLEDAIAKIEAKAGVL